MIARPLHDLTGKKEWQWGKREDEAFEKLRQQALENHILSSPDFDKQFYCRSDASNYGKGWVIYQLRDSSKPDTRDNRNTIKYGSKAWGSSMLGKPPYYLEADALITAIADAGYYSKDHHSRLWHILIKARCGL
jgi:hypothetical protein